MFKVNLFLCCIVGLYSHCDLTPTEDSDEDDDDRCPKRRKKIKLSDVIDTEYFDM